MQWILAICCWTGSVYSVVGLGVGGDVGWSISILLLLTNLIGWVALRVEALVLMFVVNYSLDYSYLSNYITTSLSISIV